MENQMYLLEIFFEKINWSTNVDDVENLRVVATLCDFLPELELTANSFPEHREHKTKNFFQLSAGKSILFSCKTDNLHTQISEKNFSLTVFDGETVLGVVQEPWSEELIEFVSKTMQGIVCPDPCLMEGDYVMIKDSKIVGEIKTIVRMYHFGNNIQTNYQILDPRETGGTRKQFLIRTANTQTTFQCQKVKSGASSFAEMLPIGPLYNPGAMQSSISSEMDGDKVSWTALYNSNITPKLSINNRPSNLFLEKPDPVAGTYDVDRYSIFDIISMVERPEENKFYDLRVRAQSGGFLIDLEQIKIGLESEKCSEKVELINMGKAELTDEMITKMLCKSKDCPAAKKFKEYGIGPLATGKGLGTVYQTDNISLPVTYGLSNTYGVFDTYGPFGLFSHTKRPEDPFMPKKLEDPFYNPENYKIPEKEKRKMCKKYCKNLLRLRGGGSVDNEDTAVVVPQSAFEQCRDVMRQFDEVLARYKRALGPCGKVTCPFSANIVRESCKNQCQHPMDFKNEEPTTYSLPNNANDNKDAVKSNKTKQPACGSQKCAFAKYKLGFSDENVDMELQFLPPATSGLCGSPKCKYQPEPELPPIHWDCPEPLPKGNCRNPNCPLMPPDLKCLNQVANNNNVCSNPRCPYALPAPCGSPYCPFAPRDCPYQGGGEADQPQAQMRRVSKSCDDQEEEVEELCDNPDCQYQVFKEDEQEQACGDPNCPYEKKQILCANPKCEYASQEEELGSLCENTTCPYNKAEEEEVCRNPHCPHQKQKNKEQRETCKRENCEALKHAPPQCFGHAPSERDEICTNLTCPYSSPRATCPNARCPSRIDCLRNLPPNLLPPWILCNIPGCVYSSAPTTIDLCPLSPAPCPYTPKKISPQPDAPSEPCDCSGDNTNICGGKLPQTSDSICGGNKDDESANGGGGGGGGSCGADSGADASDEFNEERRGSTKKYRKSLVVEKDLLPGDIEYSSDTRIQIDTRPCNVKMCKSKGGELVCEECDGTAADGVARGAGRECKKTCMGDGRMTQSTPELSGSGKRKKRKSKQQKLGKYVYTIGERYPGVKVGHKECVMPGFNVPPDKGWLWNIFTPCMSLKPRRGWRPGAIGKTIAARILEYRRQQGLEVQQLPRFRSKNKHGAYGESDTSIHVPPKPTLQIKKKDGTYWITMNPLKDPYSLVENESPYMDCTPMQFKIMKNKDNNDANNNGYELCCCGENHDEFDTEIGEKGSDEGSSESELDIEFTPPAGIIHPEMFKRRRNVIHCQTQYNEEDFHSRSKSDLVAKSEKGGKKAKKGGKKGKKK